MRQRKNSNRLGPGSRRTRPRKALFLGLMLAAATLSTTAIGGDGTLVQTKDGPVQGFINNGGVYEFLGIPYAAPPVGSLRWRPPQPPKSWNTPLQATAFGSNCPQNYEFGVFAGPPSVDEDCLFLNVFTVNPGQGKVPVLVWIHGGGLFDGESTDYDASKLAEGGPAGPTVVVTINYRLGLLGYLAHPALDSEGHDFGNYGLLDQQAALRWVRDNIAAFGGDPANVTLGGQSAGSTSTAANMISPTGKGLFRQAIWESGPLLKTQVAPLTTAEANGEGFATAAGCSSAGSDPKIAACLRALSVPQILAIQGPDTGNGPYVTGLLVDGKVLPILPDTAWATGKFNQVPILHGTVKDEWTFILSAHEYYFGPLTAEEYVNDVKTDGILAPYANSSVPNKVLALYPLTKYNNSPSLAWNAVGTDSLVCQARHLNHLLAENEPSLPLYTYEFADTKAPWYFPKLSFPPLAAHTIDIQFLFPLWHGGPDGIPHPLSLPEDTLSDELVTAWTNFMYTGNPNLAGNAPWPAYKTSAEVYLLENTPKLSTLTDAQFSAEHNCAFWEKNAVY
jgi:para-nitrobenzyl esterase